MYVIDRLHIKFSILFVTKNLIHRDKNYTKIQKKITV